MTDPRFHDDDYVDVRDVLATLDAVADAEGWATAAQVSAALACEYRIAPSTQSVAVYLVHASRRGEVEKRGAAGEPTRYGLTEAGWLIVEARS